MILIMYNIHAHWMLTDTSLLFDTDPSLHPGITFYGDDQVQSLTSSSSSYVNRLPTYFRFYIDDRLFPVCVDRCDEILREPISSRTTVRVHADVIGPITARLEIREQFPVFRSCGVTRQQRSGEGNHSPRFQTTKMATTSTIATVATATEIKSPEVNNNKHATTVSATESRDQVCV